MGNRVTALDGLRGVAAFIVVVFHFLCLLVPWAVPDMVPGPVAAADTPIAILWNGPFAVSVFFVLSGFVIAAAAQRRHDSIVTNLVTRYFRLAVPMTVSVLLAWGLLTLLPTATLALEADMATPSKWLGYTFQGDIPSFFYAVYDGLLGSFKNGWSSFNNVLWTMQYELIGSVGIFIIYWLTGARSHLVFVALLGCSVLAVALMTLPFLAFVTGVVLYEVCVRAGVRARYAIVPVIAFVVGMLLGAPGQGAHERIGLPEVPEALALGYPQGLLPVIAATLILYGVLNHGRLAALFDTSIARWLGRISFPLYLVHVPLLYTVVAYARVNFDIDVIVLGVLYVAAVLALAHLFTLVIEEPGLRVLQRLRSALGRRERAWIPARVGTSA